MNLFGEKTLRKVILNPLAQLVFVILLVFTFCGQLPDNVIRFFLTISVFLKEVLTFVLPFLLFSFIAAALSFIPRGGVLFVLGLMAMVSLSNFLNILISGSVGFLLLSDLETSGLERSEIVLRPYFDIHLPHIAESTTALLIGVAVGFINSIYPNKYASEVIKFIHDLVLKFMKKIFVPLLPLFVGGFLLKLCREGKMTGFMEHNLCVCAMMCGFLLCYLTLWLTAAASFKWKEIVKIIKNIFPAVATAFSSMSSAAALPLSLESARKNTGDKILADAVMPLTLNFHMVGDTILVPIMAMLVMLSFNHPLPSIQNFIMFGLFFVLNKFAGGGVPSGTIMVTIPVLKEFLGFDDGMVAFIVAFYGVIDPIATAGNVAANNLFVIIFQKIKKQMQIRFRRNVHEFT
ncbi:MAG: cation:dicarboxylase symporter family transporter [Holosporaceae bacterium]|jgi:Na+/H+-dicarboxylate symporter|nr:cation:dicarboxylase symporter family transporter [Holosporaceae bacterium]